RRSRCRRGRRAPRARWSRRTCWRRAAWATSWRTPRSASGSAASTRTRRSTTWPSASSPRCAGCGSSRRSTRWRRKASISSRSHGSASEQRETISAEGVMAYSEKVLDHYSNPRNVGSFAKDEPDVGTGVVGAPECGDVMKLQLKISDDGIVQDARFKTFGCGSAIASSSYVTELVKGKTIDDAMQIKNTQIVEELSLPPVKIHCSVLAEDAIKAAISDWKKRKGTAEPPKAASNQ